MNRILFIGVVVLASQLQKLDGQDQNIKTTVLTVTSQKAPLPKLRYELLPSSTVLKAANAAVSYHRAIMFMSERPKPSPEKWAKTEMELQKALEAPLGETPKDVLLAHLNQYTKELAKEIALAARCRYCDWNYDVREDKERILLLLPEVQKLRELARYQQVKTRLAIIEGRIEDAIFDLQTGFALARHVSDGGLFINHLVGIAIASLFTGELERLMTHPKCPNLYYALSHLPQPLFDLRKVIEGESRLFDAWLPKLKDLEAKMTPEQVLREMEGYSQRLQELSGNIGNPSNSSSLMNSRLAIAGMVALKLPSAKKFLIEQGHNEKEINAMPALQVVLLESALKAYDLRDELKLAFNKPYLEGIKLAEESQKKNSSIEKDPLNVLLLSIVQLIPATSRIIEAQYRLERKFLTLQIIEAVRLHQATTGVVPEKLTDIKACSVPKDPGTGQYFDYQRTATGFTLSAPPLTEFPNLKSITWKYEINLKR